MNFQMPIFAASARDDSLREQASSGGVFGLLAEAVVKRGGVVFGAAWDEQLNVHHYRAETFDELVRLYSSKYVRSNLEDCYQETKALLEAGRTILFSGTPCQLAGLRNILHNQNYPTLITLDLVCHGAPLPSVWRRNLGDLEHRHGSPVVSIRFRCKDESWHNHSVRYDFQDGSHCIRRFYDNDYFIAFLQGLSVPSGCSRCPFKGVERPTDLTLGDFWGVEIFHPEWDDDKGISLVMIHSERGQNLFESIRPDLQCHEITAEEAVAQNPAIIHNFPRHPKADYFLEHLESTDFQKLVKRCLRPSFFARFRHFLCRFMH